MQNAIPYARQSAKSVHLDIREQEEFVSAQRLVLSEQLFKECPEMAQHILFNLIESLASSKYGDLSEDKEGDLSDAEIKVLLTLMPCTTS